MPKKNLKQARLGAHNPNWNWKNSGILKHAVNGVNNADKDAGTFI